jgi:tellurite methyltransferase
MDEPDALVVRVAGEMRPGRALDLACGSGRHAIWLAERGWSVTAVDRSASAIAMLKEHSPAVDARVADLERGEHPIQPSESDLVLIILYLQRDLFAQAKLGVKPGGVLIATVLLENPAEPQARFRAKPGELRGYFEDWEILHYREGALRDHQVAEIAAQRVTASAGSAE